MTLSRYVHTGAAPATGLASGISSSATSFTVLSGTGYPSPAAGQYFVVCIDAGATSEEKILCSARSGTTFTVASSGRGYDGTTAASHSAGTTNVTHVLSAAEVDDTSDHIYTTTRDDHTQYAKTDGTRAFSGAVTITTGGLTVSAGGAAITGNSTITGNLTVTGSVTGAGLLAAVSYNPASIASNSTTSTTPVVLDSTNLTVSFTAPPSGKVMIHLESQCFNASSAYTGYWTLLGHGGNTQYGSAIQASGNGVNRVHASILVTGLTGGTSYQFDWAQYTSNASDYMETMYGGADSAAVMEVFAL